MSDTDLHSEAVQTRSVRLIALATGVTTASITLWFPFLPLYMLFVGAASEADAIFWVAAGQATQGVTRLISGPVWGVLADRHGRKKMFVRAVYCAALTTFVISVIGAPWQLCIALGLHGALSGFVPSAIALTSVMVPDGRVKQALSLVTGTQYLGSALGPLLGAGLTLLFGYRGAIFCSGLMVVGVATLVWRAVPADIIRAAGSASGTVAEGQTGSGTRAPLEAFRPGFQLLLATFIYFLLFSIATFRSVGTPIVLKGIVGDDPTHVTGVAFALGGVASALGIWLMAAHWVKQFRMGTLLACGSLLLALTHVMLAGSDTVLQYNVWFTLAALFNAGMMPATNTLIALNVSRGRRGTAFGYGSSAQAMAFMVGPMAAAGFAHFSLQTGFAVLGVVMLLMALVMKLAVREPHAGH